MKRELDEGEEEAAKRQNCLQESIPLPTSSVPALVAERALNSGAS